MPTSWRTPDIEEYRAQVRRFVTTEVAPHQQRWRSSSTSTAILWNKAAWVCSGCCFSTCRPSTAAPDGNVAHQTVMIEELTARSATRVLDQRARDRAAVHPQAGHRGMKRRYLPKLASGEMVGAIAMTEPGGGSDLQGAHARRAPGRPLGAERRQDVHLERLPRGPRGRGRAHRHGSPAVRGISLLLVETGPSRLPRRSRAPEARPEGPGHPRELLRGRTSADAVLGGETGRGFYQLMTELPLRAHADRDQRRRGRSSARCRSPPTTRASAWSSVPLLEMEHALRPRRREDQGAGRVRSSIAASRPSPRAAWTASTASMAKL